MGRNFIWSWRFILGPILFNIFLSDLFLFIKNSDVASYDDDTTPYKTGLNSAYVTHNVEALGNTLLNCFNDNSMKANHGKYHLVLSGNDSSKPLSEMKQFPVKNAKNV